MERNSKSRIIIMVLGLMAYIWLFFLDWKIGLAIFFITYSHNAEWHYKDNK